jgi:hypothetical protein
MLPNVYIPGPFTEEEGGLDIPEQISQSDGNNQGGHGVIINKERRILP